MENNRGVISLKFNQDQGCFTCCMESGLRIYNVDPLVEKTRFSLEHLGTLSICEMLNRTNLLAIVAGGSRPKFASNTVLIYDDHAKKLVLEVTFMSAVKAVRLRRDKMVVALRHQLHVFSFPAPAERLFTVETRDNIFGLCEITPIMSAERQILLFPGHKIGTIRLVELAHIEAGAGMSSSPVTIPAHQSELACLAVNQQGTLISTASTKGTIVRIFETLKGTAVAEFRRGMDSAAIYCITFSRDSEFLCVSSDKGTVHLFGIKNIKINRRMVMRKVGNIFGNSFSLMYGFASFTVAPERACVCAFGSRNSVVAICLDGTFHKYVFNEDGSCNREAYDVFLDVCGGPEF